MKKTIIILGLIVVYIGAAVSSSLGYENLDYDLSDSELIAMFYEELYPDKTFDEVCICPDGTDSDWIRYEVLEDNNVVDSGTVDRGFALRTIAK